jgi:imidazolonepropionase-like amidohydrolase
MVVQGIVLLDKKTLFQAQEDQMKDQVVLTRQVIGGKDPFIMKDKAIRVQGGIITDIIDMADFRPPDGARMHDWRDFVVTPGLIDCHDHLGLETGDEHAQAMEHDFINVLRGVYNARRLLSAGITTLRSVGEKNYMDVYWRDAVEKGWMPGPRLVICCKFIMRTGGHAWYLGKEADGPDAIRVAVREQIKYGADAIKLMITGGASTDGTSPTASDYSDEEIYAAVEEAHRLGKKVAAHVHGGPGARAAIDAGIDSIEHGVYLTDEDLALMAQKGTFLCITYGVYFAAARSETAPQFMKDRCAEAAKQYLKTIANARKHNVKVVFGGDTYHADPTSEYKGLIQAGYTPEEAFCAATSTAADLLGMQEKIGSIEVGKYADLVCFRGNPLDDPDAMGDVAHVMKSGRVYGPETL